MAIEERSPAIAKEKGMGLIEASEMVDSSARLLKRRILKTKVAILIGKMILFLRNSMAVG